jgi:hypothetical protein
MQFRAKSHERDRKGEPTTPDSQSANVSATGLLVKLRTQFA